MKELECEFAHFISQSARIKEQIVYEKTEMGKVGLGISRDLLNFGFKDNLLPVKRVAESSLKLFNFRKEPIEVGFFSEVPDTRRFLISIIPKRY